MLKYFFVAALIPIQIVNLYAHNNGSIITSTSQYQKSRVFYIGISTSEAVLENSFRAGPFKSDSDLVHLTFLLKEKFKVNDSSMHPIYHPEEVLQLQRAFTELMRKMHNNDIFIFHFAGISWPFLMDSFGNKTQTRYYLQRKRNDKRPSEFFTMNMLKFWLDLIPARNQILIIDGGITANLKVEIARSLTERDLSKYLVEQRKRVIIANYGMGLEIPSGGILSSSIAQVLGNYKESYHAFDDIFSDRKRGLYFQSHLQQIMDSLNRHGNCELNMIREWEMVSLLNNYKIEFSTDTAKSRGDNIILKAKPQLAPKETPPKSYALIVATDEYQFLPRLNNPVFDGFAIENLLHHKFGYETKMLLNCKAADFYKALLYFKDSVQFGVHDQFLIYIAGHGTYNSFMEQGAIAFADAEPVSRNPGMNNYLQHVNLLNMLNNFKCKNLMVILDVCYGGTLSVGSGNSQDVNACGDGSCLNQEIQGLNKNDCRLVMQNLNCANRCFLTSGGNEYVPDGAAGAHSPFSKALLDCLEKCGGVMYASDLTNQIRKSMQEDHSGAPTPASGKFGVNSTQTDYVYYVLQH